ncbi:MAG: signal peptide peptidase SppA, 36K type [Micrococcales bacterium]|nr:MAG: signal peptide peptidase SppA, 36K type [Micrococcales bacterium]PIE27112.1 MAG: signal peptide peptidase SppA, 36K type [Micrococcales bacterium]
MSKDTPNGGNDQSANSAESGQSQGWQSAPQGGPGATPVAAPQSGPPGYGQQWPSAPAPVTPPRERGGFRRGFGLGAGAGLGAGLMLLILGVVGALISGLMFVGLAGAAANTNTAENQPIDHVWGEEGATSTLRVVEVNGPILGSKGDGAGLDIGTYGYEVADMIDELDKDDTDGLILELNTPGGTIYGSRAIADAVSRYQDRTGRKVMAYVRGMSASGGMYAMAGADEVIADHGTFVGSIGVIAGPFQRYRDVTAIDGTLLTPGITTKGGIERQYLSKGKGKDFGDPFRDMTAEEKATFMAGLDDEYNAFVNHVSRGRDISAQVIKDDLGAYIFGAKQAKQKGLIDEELGREEAYRHAAELNELNPSDTKVVKARTPGFLQQLLGAESRVFGSAPAVVPQEGQPARVTSVICVGEPLVLAYHGDLADACG